jgi:hypothetical protein
VKPDKFRSWRYFNDSSLAGRNQLRRFKWDERPLFRLARSTPFPHSRFIEKSRECYAPEQEITGFRFIDLH